MLSGMPLGDDSLKDTNEIILNLPGFTILQDSFSPVQYPRAVEIVSVKNVKTKQIEESMLNINDNFISG
jgi:hypothetical protein